jgi:hypothetical protein
VGRPEPDPLSWLFPRGAGGLRQAIGRCDPDALQEALRFAYWAARRALVTGVEARYRHGIERRAASLARLEEALVVVLALDDPVPVELRSYLNAALDGVQAAARRLARPPEPGYRGRPRGWHRDAERALLGLGLRRSEARALLSRVEQLVRARPVTLREGPPLRVAFGASEPTRSAILQHLPIHSAQKH